MGISAANGTNRADSKRKVLLTLFVYPAGLRPGANLARGPDGIVRPTDVCLRHTGSPLQPSRCLAKVSLMRREISIFGGTNCAASLNGAAGLRCGAVFSAGRLAGPSATEWARYGMALSAQELHIARVGGRPRLGPSSTLGRPPGYASVAATCVAKTKK